MRINCCVCGKGPMQGVTVHRINRTGIEGLWACAKHMKQIDGKIDPEAKKLIDILERK